MPSMPLSRRALFISHVGTRRLSRRELHDAMAVNRRKLSDVLDEAVNLSLLGCSHVYGGKWVDGGTINLQAD